MGLNKFRLLGIGDPESLLRCMLASMPKGSKLALVLVQKSVSNPPFDILIIDQDGLTDGRGRGTADAKNRLDFDWLYEQLPEAEVYVVAKMSDLTEFCDRISEQVSGWALTDLNNPLNDLLDQLMLNDRLEEVT